MTAALRETPAPTNPPTKTVTLEIDGRTVTVPEGTSVYDAAKSLQIDVPVLCHDPRLRPVGVCRMCVVEIEGARTLQASCVRPAESGMKVKTGSAVVVRNRKMLCELLMADQRPASARDATTGDDQLFAIARDLGADASRLKSVTAPAAVHPRKRDNSSHVIAVDHQACILCDRCIRACDDVQGNHVIGRSGKGYGTTISFDTDVPMGTSTCVECGECASVCPTGALTNKPVTIAMTPRNTLKQVESVCPYCGVGCALKLHVDTAANRVVMSEGRSPSGNDARLCVKGRYGFDYASHPHRLTKPLIRKETAYPKGPLTATGRREDDGTRGADVYPDYAQALSAFREATWDEALDLVARRLREARDRFGSPAMAGFGSAKCSNEEAYLFQKMVRSVFGTNNVDHCTRLCHASSVAALLECVGSGAVSTIYRDIENSDVAILTGTNTTSNHPVAATFFKEAARKGTKLIVIDVRRPDIADHAWQYVQILPGSDVSFYNAVMHVILEEGLEDRAYIEKFTENFEALREVVKRYTPEVASPICGIEPDRIRLIARTIGAAKAMLVFWGMGISQHVHGTDNARCLISLCLVTGNVGRPGTGLHPLRGQNNVQGASDAGLIPMMYPDYQPVANDATREKFQKAWGTTLDPNPGKTVVEISHAVEKGTVLAMYVMGENPFLSDPNVQRVRDAFCKLDFLVVQDIFLTETAEVADVVLPSTSYFEKTGTYTNTDRRVQLGRPALDPPGEARLDWRILVDVMERMGAKQPYRGIEDVFDEFVRLNNSYANLAYRHLGGAGKLWPCPDPENSEGTVVLFGDGFPTKSGRAKFSPAEVIPPAELPSAEFPFVLNTGRTLQHWHTGSMTRRAKMLDAIEPEAYCEMNAADLVRLGIADDAFVRLSTRRNSIRVRVRATHKVQLGGVFIPFHFREAAANLLTNDVIDPKGKIPEFKFCAVNVEAA
ncbi:MAG: formate dehydrogenase subunit alpha [Planctomycetes bacterium]|nr:formate dehydrogenase subunit alpha [Planctomycetota bacterium]